MESFAFVFPHPIFHLSKTPHSSLDWEHDRAKPIQEYEEQYCPVDGFQLITYSTGSGMTGRSFSLCPNCYNNTPFPDMEDNCGCNKCTHSSCQHSMVARGIVPCQDCEGGMVCLDPVSQAKKWRATCNSCSFVLGFPKTVKSLPSSHLDLTSILKTNHFYTGRTHRGDTVQALLRKVWCTEDACGQPARRQDQGHCGQQA